MTLDTPKGVRDFLPQEKILRQSIVQTLQTVFERYGYNPLETPALELFETLSSKYAGGDEILKETYKLTDNGQRQLGLRYDLTVPFARVLGMNPNLKLPFKRYQIDRVWRDGPLKAGRYREFWQCDVDVAGASSLIAEAELLTMAVEVFKSLDVQLNLTVNNRKVLDSMLDTAGVDKELWIKSILIIDKLKKIGMGGVIEELQALGLSGNQIGIITTILSIQGTNTEKINALKGILKDPTGANELEELQSYLEAMGTQITVDVSLSRGLSYYTGIVFEGYAVNSNVKSSLCAGGRFDGMIALLAQRKDQIPAVGISFGLDVIMDVMKTSVSKSSLVKVFVVPIKAQKQTLPLLTKIRNAGINADIDLCDRGISKNLAFANAYGIPYVLIVGENELADGKFTLKDMVKGEERKLAIEEVIAALR